MSRKICVISAKFNDFIVKHLTEGCIGHFKEQKAVAYEVTCHSVPGAFELPLAAKLACEGKNSYDAIICLGAVIRGETPHFDYVCQGAASGILNVSLESGIPVIFGVLTTDNANQALMRCGIKGMNKGIEAAQSAIEMIDLKNTLGDA